jgi:hypothetical protein
MVNGLGVLGYGVGGIEAEAVLPRDSRCIQPMPHVGRRPPPRRAAARLDRDRSSSSSSPSCSARTVSSARSSSSTATASATLAVADRTDDQQHEPRVRGDLRRSSRSTRRRLPTCA